MSTGAIHYWFEGRDEVLIAALEWASGKLFERLEELAAEADTERERLVLLLEHAVPVPGPRRGEYVLWMELWVRALQEPGLLPECEALSHRWRGYFLEAVRRGAESGEFSPISDPDEAAERLIAQVDGLGFERVLVDVAGADARAPVCVRCGAARDRAPGAPAGREEGDRAAGRGGRVKPHGGRRARRGERP